MRAVIMDRDAGAAHRAADIASEVGLKPLYLAEGTDIIAALARDAPQVIVLDLLDSGIESVRQLHLLARQQYSGALILTGHCDQPVLDAARTLAEGLGLWVVATFVKPVAAKALEDVLRGVRAACPPASPDRLLAAIDRGEMRLDFQPIVSHGRKVVKRLEALIRWDHPADGLLPPADFVAVAETRPDVIRAMTTWVVNKAIESYQILRETGIQLPIAINLSAQNLLEPGLPDMIAASLHAAGMPAEHLCLEISERSRFSNITGVTQLLTRLRLHGMPLSLDDFGSGHSSLQLLRQLPFSEIKIDRSFVGDMPRSYESRVIVQSVIDLAKNLGMTSVAEGVETEQVESLLGSMGIDAIQGQLIGPPMPVRAIPSWHAFWTGQAAAPAWTSPDSIRVTSIQPALDRTAGASAMSGRHDSLIPGPPESISRRSPLSARQRDVMQLLAEGRSVKDIARTLGLGIGTVKVHVSRAYATLGARNRVEAIMRAATIVADSGSSLEIANS
ncbi:MAG TPA: EAL domain-containing protein [Acetobacteraceae bacterium]|nr:EAL domain-containing protein [Acetobacteraceae bacterium]